MAMSVDLGSRLEQTVEDLVANGRYGSKSEVLREGVRLVEEREARAADLRASIEKGIKELDAGLGIPAEEVFANLRTRLAKKQKAAGKRKAG